jgi:LuxR family maltose regulon positive regulatory protein
VKNDRPADALHHARHATDTSLIVEVIEAAWRPLILSHYRQVHEALVSIPLEAFANNVRATAIRDIVLEGPDERILNAAARLPNAADSIRLAETMRVRDVLDTAHAVMIAMRRRGQFEQASTQARRLLASAAIAREKHPDQVADLVPSIQLVAAQTLLLAGDLAGSLQPLHRAYDWSADSPLDYIEPDAAASLAFSHAIDGRTDIAEKWLERYAARPDTSTWLEPSIRGKADVARLLLSLDRLDLDAAHDHARTDPLDDRLGIQEWWAFRIFAHSRHALHAGTAPDALDLLDRGRALFSRWMGHSAAAGPLLAAAEADLLLALGRGNHATRIFEGPHGNHPLLQVGRARLALLTGDNVTAIRLATDPAWQRSTTTRHRHEMLLVHAVAAHRERDLPSAISALQHAVGSTRATGALRPFTTVHRGELRALADHVPAAAAILDAPVLANSRDLFPREIRLVVLTKREQKVLEKIATGLSIHQVATALHVSYSTVRTQQRSLYRKLQAESQSDAIARAQQSGLLSPEMHRV